MTNFAINLYPMDHTDIPDNPIVRLNLPPADLDLRRTERGVEVYDRLRKKWLLLTPEEWVRQQFTSYLINHKGYVAGFIANEVSITLNGTSRRCDTVIYDHRLHPLVIVEYKEPGIAITQNVFDQIARYNIVLQVKYLIVSNGLKHYCCEVDSLNNRCKFIQDIPTYQDICGS